MINEKHEALVKDLHPRGRCGWASKMQLHGLYTDFDKARADMRRASANCARYTRERRSDEVEQAQREYAWAIMRYAAAVDRIYFIAEQDHVNVTIALLDAKSK